MVDFSSPPGESAAPAPAPLESRPSGGAVFGVSVVFLVIAGLLLQLTSLGVGSIDAEELVTELFGEAGLPGEFEVEKASRLYTGEDVLELSRRYDLEEDPQEPTGLVFLSYKSPAAVTPLFESGGGDRGGRGGPGGPGGDDEDDDPSERMVKWEEDPSFDWHTVIESDDIAWGVWKTRYRIDRAFQKGGDWSDSIRIDLSSPLKGRVLFVQWPNQEPVNMASLRRLLSRVQIAGPEETPVKSGT